MFSFLLGTNLGVELLSYNTLCHVRSDGRTAFRRGCTGFRSHQQCLGFACLRILSNPYCHHSLLESEILGVRNHSWHVLLVTKVE